MSSSDPIRFADSAELNRAIQRLADAAGATAREVLPSQMRLLAADLAFNTRPIGKTASAQKEGQEKVERRITTVYPSVGMMADLLAQKEERLKKAFIAQVKKRNFAAAAKLLNDVFSSNYTVGEFDGGRLHKDQQFTRRADNRLVVTNYTKVTQYIREKKKIVGFAKGGFAAAARELGGVRGIPGFATRQPSPGSGRVTGDGRTLTVIMTNAVKYIKDALDPHGEQRALDFRQRSITTLIRRMMDSRLRRASRSIR